MIKMALKVLIVEDSEDDAELLVHELKKSFSLISKRVETAKSMAAALKEQKWDIVLSDYSMPRFNGVDALKELKKSKRDIPFILVSGKIGEETAVEAMNAGVHDYILKDNMARLVPAIKRELEEAEIREKRRQANEKLKEYREHLEKMVNIRTAELSESNEKLKEEKKRYEELFQNAPDGYLSVDVDNKVQEANDTFIDMSGYSRDELIGKSISILFGEENVSVLVNDINKNIEIGLKKKGNETLPVSVHIQAKIADGKLVGSKLTVRDISEVKRLEKEKATLVKEVIQLTEKIPLTDNEKLVLYSLVRHPLLNDVELSRKLKLKRSTITAIRNKLSRENYYFTYRIPSFSMLGCELATVIYGEMNPLLEDEATKVIQELSSAPEQVYLDATPNSLAGVCISKNMTELKKHIDNFVAKCEKKDVAGNFRISYFPFETSRFEKILDFSGYLKKIFELDLKEDADELSRQAGRNMTPNEKKIIYALVKFPSYTDSRIAEIIKMPRPSISQTRVRLLEDGFLKEVNMPNLIKVGSELMELEHMQLDYDAPPDMMNDIISHMKDSVNCCSIIVGSNELFALNAYRDYTEYENVKNKNVRFYDEHNLKLLAANIHPILAVRIFKLNFAPLVSKILGLNVDF